MIWVLEIESDVKGLGTAVPGEGGGELLRLGDLSWLWIGSVGSLFLALLSLPVAFPLPGHHESA